MGLQNRSDRYEIRVAQSARRVRRVLLLRTFPHILGRSGRRFRDRLRHREERSAVRIVVREIDRRLRDGAQTGAFAWRVFHRGRRQHTETVDVEQGAKEHPRT